MLKLFSLIFILSIAATQVCAQTKEISNPPGATLASFDSFLTSRELILAVGIIGFGLVITVIQFLLLRSVVDKHISEIFKIFTVTLIIISTLLLIAVGFNSEQIAPALGLFGTIAGYLLARSDNDSRKSPPPKQHGGTDGEE